uniref:Transcription factor TFIIB cyclin-like domain-containing protein n=2 Tax=Palpitomonas bilix TaxID=652834 RepID=A0A7S3DC07_9EUKA|mmetsp:Transcript_31069/g.81535  ORF Transcript_31069/g.81535 Transcript_31069/m.81535 type:complete len:270 (+) Transcript_31069:187-996(+)
MQADQHLIEEGQTGIMFEKGDDYKSQAMGRAHNSGSASKDQKRRETAFKEIAMAGEQLRLPREFSDRAKEIFAALDKQKPVKKKDIKLFSVAVLHAACVDFGNGRSLRELGGVTGLDAAQIGKCVKLVQKVVTLKSFVQGKDIIPRMLDRLGISNITHPRGEPSVFRLEKTLIETFENAKKRVIQNSPQHASIAGAILYLVLNRMKDPFFHRDLVEISSSTGMAKSTINNIVQILVDKADIFLPSPLPDWLAFDMQMKKKQSSGVKSEE